MYAVWCSIVASIATGVSLEDKPQSQSLNGGLVSREKPHSHQSTPGVFASSTSRLLS